MANQSHRRSSAEDASFRSQLKRIESSVGKGTRPRKHADIFRRGPAAWNKWRNKNRSALPDLSGLTLAPGERQMGPENGGPINLSSCLLRGASLRSARLPGADLDSADLSGADLCHGRLERAELRGADLSGACLDHANLTGATARKARLRGARLRSVNLTDADFEGADLSSADLLHARLRGANLAGVNFREARLDHADFDQADLTGANLAGASLHHAKNLTSAQLQKTKGSESTSLPPHLVGTVSWSSAKRARKSSASVSRHAVASRPRRDPTPSRIHRRVAWIAAAALSTLVVIGFAMKHSSEAVPFLPPATPKVPELNLAAATGSGLASKEQRLLAAVATSEVLGADPTHNVAEETAPPRLFAALSESRGTPHPAPAVLDEAPDHSLPIAHALRAAPLQQITPDQPAASIQPDVSLSPVRTEDEKPRKIRVAALKQATLRPVATSRTIRLREAPADIPLAEPSIDGPMTLVVSLRHQKLDVYRGARLVETTKISSGMKDHETRAGVFSILEKRRYHHSNMYSNAPMPWMQRLTRSGTALHGGVLPGYPASHGCIRLPFSFATKLFQMTEVGVNVVVAEHDITPTRIDHPNLPQPVSVALNNAQSHAELETNNAATTADAGGVPPLRILVTRRTLRDRLISVQYALSSLGYLRHRDFTGRIGNETRAAIRSFQKANDMPVTGTLTKELAAAIYQAAGQEVPPEGHLFVRQGYNRLFDTPVAFSDPERTLGTHVFAGMYPASGETKIVWLAMSLEEEDGADTLDRIQIPEALRERLAAALTPGSTFIIGDLSADTAILPDGDDFVVLTKDVPAVAESETLQETKQAAVRKKASRPKQAKRSSRRATREARRYLFAPRHAPRGLFSRW